MFCPNCACELPAVAKFCVKCGSRVAVPTVRQASVSFCTNCAKPLDPSDKFCSSCGQKVIQRQAEIRSTTSDIEPKNLAKQANDLTEAVQPTRTSHTANGVQKESAPVTEPPSPGASSRVSQTETGTVPSSAPNHVWSTTRLPAEASTEITQAVVAANSESAPYAKFVVQLLLACLCASVGVFAFFDASARRTSAFGVETLSVALAVVFGWLGWATYKVILNRSKNEPELKHRSRKALVTSVILIFLYLGLAALLGSVIGQNRAEAIQLTVDIEHQKELAGRITKERSAVSNSISSYLDMYARIESDVKDYSSTVLRVKQELYLYDSKFPEQAESMRQYASTIEREIRRSDLLKKQIASAKQIGLLDPYQQLVAWRSEMVPMLEEEDALDKSK